MIPAFLSLLWAQAPSCWNNITPVLLSLLLLALLLDYVMFRKTNDHFPPGPAPLPFLGNVMDFWNPQPLFQQLAEKYGPVFSFQAGWKKIVVLNGFKMVTEALKQKAEALSDRPYVPLLSLAGYTKQSEGIIMARHCAGWKEQRKFCVSTLKNFGMGKKSLEKQVSQEAGYLCSAFKSQEGSPFNPHDLVTNASGNIICTLVFGDRFDYNDETFLKLMHLIADMMKILAENIYTALLQISWLSYVPGPHHKIRNLNHDLSAIIREIVNRHKETRDPTFARDLIDTFLEEIEKAKGNPESTFNEQNLIKIIFDLIGAGTETIASTMVWGLLKLVLLPEVQKRVHEEIDEVLGRDKPPTMGDQPDLPYTNAVIHEIQRYANVAPMAFPYATHQDVHVDKFVIPKGTMVFNHMSSVLQDESMWEKPHEFYPEHFLDANGQFVKPEAFLPFSVGRHACPGEQMAKTELFIFFTSLLQRFTFCIPENHPRPKEDRPFALTVTPHPFQICAIPR